MGHPGDAGNVPIGTLTRRPERRPEDRASLLGDVLRVPLRDADQGVVE